MDFYSLRLLNLALAGAGLGISGRFLQRISGTSIADPYILGIAPAAMLGYLLSKVVFSSSSNEVIQWLFGIALSLLAIASVLFRSNGWKSSLLLVGISLGSFCLSLSSIIVYLHPDIMQSGYSKLFGLSMLDYSSSIVRLLLGVLITLAIFSGDLVFKKIFTLSEVSNTRSINLGNNFKLFISFIILLSCFLSCFITIEFGIISFIGFLAPNLVRLVLGNSFPMMTLIVAIVGAAILLIADQTGRLIAPPYGLPVSVLVSIVSVPFFVLIGLRQREQS